MKNKLERIKKYHNNLERIKRYTEINKTKTLSEITFNLHIDHSVVSLLKKKDILVNFNNLVTWNDKIPITTKLAETIVNLNDEYYNGLKSRQSQNVLVTTKRISKKKQEPVPGLFKRIWKAIMNN
jgi:hypothetical protein